MGRFDTERDYGSNVTRTVNPNDRGFLGVLFESRKPVLSSSLTLHGDIQDAKTRELLRAATPSGVLEWQLAQDDRLFLGTQNGTYALDPYEFMVQGFDVVIDGHIVEIRGSRVGGSFFHADWNTIRIDNSLVPLTGQATVLLFLEVWPVVLTKGTALDRPNIDEIYPLGNRDWGDTFYNDDLVDYALQPARPTDGRVQLQYQWRQVAVDRAVAVDPMLHPNAKAEGSAGSPTAFGFSRLSGNLDGGLYVAGDGLVANGLGSANGYVFGIPVCLVGLRNTSPFDYVSNLNGGSVSVGSGNPSDRYDGLYYDEIALSDIEDLRHGVSLGPLDYAQLCQEDLNALLQGDNPQIRLALGGGQQAAKLLQSDAIWNVPPGGVTKIGEPDGVRTVFMPPGATQTATDTVVPNTPDTTGQVHLVQDVPNPGDRQIQITVDSVNKIGTVTLKWRKASGATPNVVTTSISTPTDYQYIAQLDTGDADFVDSDTIDVLYEVEYYDAAPVEFSEAIHEMQRVLWSDFPTPTLDDEVAFAENTELVREAGSAVSATYPPLEDEWVDYNVLNPSYQDTSGPQAYLRGYMRLLTVRVNGATGVTNYSIPRNVQGFDLEGVVAVRNATTSTEKYPNIIDRDGSNYHVNFAAAPANAGETLEFDMVVATQGVVYSRAQRGVLRTVEVAEVEQTFGVSITEAIIEVPGRILSLPSFKNTLGDLEPYLYVEPTAPPGNAVRYPTGGVTITMEIINERSIRVTFSASIPANSKLVIPVVYEWEVPENDGLVFVYDYQPWPGLSALSGAIADDTEFEVVGRGRPFVHTYGAGYASDEVTWADRFLDFLPRARHELIDFDGRQFKFPDEAFYHRYGQFDQKFYIFQEASWPMEVGQKLQLVSDAGALKLAGYDQKSLIPLEENRHFSLNRPNIEFDGGNPTGGEAAQAVYPFLIRQLDTGELYLLVITGEVESDTQSFEFIPDSDEPTVSFEIYPTRKRWINWVG